MQPDACMSPVVLNKRPEYHFLMWWHAESLSSEQMHEVLLPLRMYAIMIAIVEILFRTKFRIEA